ncbi:MAG: hypothetical protein N2645_03450 [Clostridia bacterium]|nr:hypothetical protein [Clostridia bacterium]
MGVVLRVQFTPQQLAQATITCNTTATPRTLTVQGTANVTFSQPSEPDITGTGTVTYTFFDGGQGAGNDSFQISVTNATNPALNFTSGLVILNGNFVIGQCQA